VAASENGEEGAVLASEVRVVVEASLQHKAYSLVYGELEKVCMTLHPSPLQPYTLLIASRS
jgi:hypothetical protein